MRIALVNQFYPPGRAPTGGLLSDLACELHDRGHQVTVITSARVYDKETDTGNDTRGITIHRIGPRSQHGRSLIAKLSEYTRFLPEAYRVLSRLDPKPDLVLCMTTPPFCGLIAKRLKRKKGVPFVLWCMDLYPEALSAAGILKDRGILYRMLARLTRAERSQARAIVTLGPDMTRRILASVPEARVAEIPVWSRLAITPTAWDAARTMRRSRGWRDDETILLYSGNIGRAHRVDEFVELAKRLRNKPARMVFCGEGPLKEEWQRAGGELFEWVEPVNATALASHLLAADVHLVSQQPPWTGIVVPSKFQAACAVQRPVLFAGPADSAVANWIQAFDNGWVIPPGDRKAINRAARHLSRSTATPANPFNADTLKTKLSRQLEQLEALDTLPLPVTVVIPVLDEEQNLPECLASLGNAFAGIVVVDSGSTDRTCEIARSSGAELLQFRWDGKSEKKRNWTLRHYAFKTKWVLFLDADERVTPDFVAELRSTLPTTTHVGFHVPFTNWFMGRPLHHGDVFRKLPLFRIDAGAYERFPENGWSTLDMEIHEHPVLNGTLGAIHARIEHKDFRSMTHYLNKHEQYAEWEANRYRWLKMAGRTVWKQLTPRQRLKYGMLDKPGLGLAYFFVAYMLKFGFLDGHAGFELARAKCKYFNLIRRKIRSIPIAQERDKP